MKKILFIIFMFCIVALFATVNLQIFKHEINPPKNVSRVNTEINKPDKLCSACSDALRNGIAACYNVENGDVCCINSGTPTYYYITSLAHLGEITFSSCGSNCTHCCLLVYPSNNECCFDIHCIWPE